MSYNLLLTTLVDIDYSKIEMVRIVAIALFALSVRIFSTPSLCTHSMMDSSINEIQAPVMTHCHKHIVAAKKDAPKHVPCNHMKQCLLDAVEDDSFFQKSAVSITSTNGINFVYYIPSMSQNLVSATMQSTILMRPPPERRNSGITLYLAKYSFLI